MRSLCAAAALALGACAPAEQLADHPATSPPPTAQALVPTSADAMADFEQRYERACGSLEGPFASWREIEPTRHDIYAQGDMRAACLWKVQGGAKGAEAVLVRNLDEAVELPFRPTWTPSQEVMACMPKDAVASVEEVDTPMLPRHHLALADGTHLVGYNDGEFGGGLVHYDRLGCVLERVSDDHVRAISKDEGAVLVFVGLRHMVSEYGAILRLTRTGGRWSVARHELDETPYAVTDDGDGGFLIATSRHLMRTEDGTQTKRLMCADWQAPTSIVQGTFPDVYVGMRGQIARVARYPGGQYGERWLVPSE